MKDQKLMMALALMFVVIFSPDTNIKIIAIGGQVVLLLMMFYEIYKISAHDPFKKTYCRSGCGIEVIACKDDYCPNHHPVAKCTGCGKKKGAFEMPHMTSEVLCSPCYKGYDSPYSIKLRNEVEG